VKDYCNLAVRQTTSGPGLPKVRKARQPFLTSLVEVAEFDKEVLI
jgi:hypothetical protein